MPTYVLVYVYDASFRHLLLENAFSTYVLVYVYVAFLVILLYIYIRHDQCMQGCQMNKRVERVEHVLEFNSKTSRFEFDSRSNTLGLINFYELKINSTRIGAKNNLTQTQILGV